VVTAEQQRTAVREALPTADGNERRACRWVGVDRSTIRYRSRRPSDAPLRERLRELAAEHPRWGSPRLAWRLRRDGWTDNHKRIERCYRAEGLAVRRRRRKRVAVARIPLVVPAAPNELWAMDFVRDTLADGRVFRSLTLVDACTREAPVIEVAASLTGDHVVAVLDRLALTRGLPRGIVVDNGPEFQSRALDQWADARGVQLHFIRPGKPVENAYIESFNGRFRDECLNHHYFLSLADARRIIEGWRLSYNTARPHGALHGLTPAEFATQFSSPQLEGQLDRLSA
jgi:putative transposase